MINSKTIQDAVYNLCVQANTVLPENVFEKILEAYNSETNEDAKEALNLILENAQMAAEKKMPLCQDTGQVLVFIRGKNIPYNIKEIVNRAVSKAYEENFFRKSIVKDAVFNRVNTKTNTPCIVYTEITNSEELEIELLVKGGGSENVCAAEMISPTATENEIIDYVVSVVKKAGAKGCPPYFIGIGIGGTIDYAAVLSKKALLLEDNKVQSKPISPDDGGLVNPPYDNDLSQNLIVPQDDNHKNLAKKIQNAVNKLNIGAAGLGGASTCLDVKILTDFTHIACMPVAVTLNCHSFRHAMCRIKGNSKWEIVNSNKYNLFPIPYSLFPKNDYIKVHTSDFVKLKSLKPNQNILLSGEIYTARDMAHKRLVEMIEKGEKLPFDLKDKIIFYAGPCPCSGDCVVGSIGPTTASRMDKFTPLLYKNGILATIGKGERSEEVKIAVKQAGGLYFTAIGGIACYLAQRFIKKDLVCFEDLGAEAIYRFEIKDLPLRVDII